MNFKKYIFPIFLLLLYSTCIDEIALPVNSEEPLVVVNGLLTNVFEKQTIRLSLSTGVNIQLKNVVSGAEVYVESQDGERVLFSEQEEGTYTAIMKAEPGQQYRLYAILPDGNILTSNLQNVPTPFPLNEIEFIDTMVTVLDQNGNFLRVNSLDFYAKGNTPMVSEEQYLRFDFETVYQIKEALCTPFISPDTCFVFNDEFRTDVILMRINPSDAPVNYRQYIYRRRINTDLSELFSLDLYLYAYNKNEYEYWENLKSLIDQNGTVTDQQPARLRGNITASDGSEILGQFAVVGKSRQTQFISNQDFEAIIYPFCGRPGNVPDPIPPICCNCLDLKGASSRRPAYWF